MALAFGKDEQGGRTLPWWQCRQRTVNLDLPFDRCCRRHLDFDFWPTSRLASFVEETARGDGPEPSGEARIAAPLAALSPGNQQRILCQVIGLVLREPSQVPPETRLVLAHERGEGGEVAPRRPAD